MQIVTFSTLFILLKSLSCLAEPFPYALAEAENHAELYEDLILAARDLLLEDELFDDFDKRDEIFDHGELPFLYARDLYRRAKKNPGLKIDIVRPNIQAPPSSKPLPANKKEYSRNMAAHTAEQLKDAKANGRAPKDPSQYNHGPTKQYGFKDSYFDHPPATNAGFPYQDPGSSKDRAPPKDRSSSGSLLGPKWTFSS